MLQVEVKLQRNVGADGDGPAANDTRPLIAPVRLMLGRASFKDNFVEQQHAAVRANVSDPLMTFVVNTTGREPMTLRRSMLNTTFVQRLPHGVRLQSLRWLGRGNVLIRFVNYNNIPVDIQTDTVVLMLAPPLPRLSNLQETTLTGTSVLTDAAARRLRWHSAPAVSQTTGVKTTTAESLIAADVANGTSIGLANLRLRALSVHTYSATIEGPRNP